MVRIYLTASLENILKTYDMFSTTYNYVIVQQIHDSLRISCFSTFTDFLRCTLIPNFNIPYLQCGVCKHILRRNFPNILRLGTTWLHKPVLPNTTTCYNCEKHLCVNHIWRFCKGLMSVLWQLFLLCCGIQG